MNEANGRTFTEHLFFGYFLWSHTVRNAKKTSVTFSKGDVKTVKGWHNYKGGGTMENCKRVSSLGSSKIQISLTTKANIEYRDRLVDGR